MWMVVTRGCEFDSHRWPWSLHFSQLVSVESYLLIVIECKMPILFLIYFCYSFLVILTTIARSREIFAKIAHPWEKSRKNCATGKSVAAWPSREWMMHARRLRSGGRIIRSIVSLKDPNVMGCTHVTFALTSETMFSSMVNHYFN